MLVNLLWPKIKEFLQISCLHCKISYQYQGIKKGKKKKKPKKNIKDLMVPSIVYTRKIDQDMLIKDAALREKVEIVNNSVQQLYLGFKDEDGRWKDRTRSEEERKIRRRRKKKKGGQLKEKEKSVTKILLQEIFIGSGINGSFIAIFEFQ